MSSPGQQYNNPTGQNYNEPVQPAPTSILNFSYFKTIFFIIKVAIILLCIAGAISVSVRYAQWPASGYYNFVAVTGIVVAVIFTLLNVFRITDKLSKIPWIFIEMIYDVLWAILFLIAAAIMTDYARKYQEMDSYAAGAFFGYACMLLYLVDASFRFVYWRKGGSKLSKGSSATQSQPTAGTLAPSNTYEKQQPNY